VSRRKISTCRILHLIPYSAFGPIHGGKIRVQEISKVLTKIDADVEIMYLDDSDYKTTTSKFDLTDIPRAIVGDLEMFQRDFSLTEFEFVNLEAIVFEHPWLWNEVKRLKKKNPKAKIFYSSHNVEYQLKDEILLKYLGQRASAISEEIRTIEIEVSTSADKVFVVSEQDKEWYAQFTKDEPVLAPNGARERIPLTGIKGKESTAKALVVGSAHPPNIEGCLRFLNDLDLWLPYNAKIVVAGSLAAALAPYWGNLKNRWGEPCIDLIPEVSDFELTNLLEDCNVILLPIAYGGGTNLKSAEALVAGRPIVASRQAFRGFENHIQSTFVDIAETNFDFKILTTARLMGKRIPSLNRDVLELLWESTLRPIENSIREVIND